MKTCEECEIWKKKYDMKSKEVEELTNRISELEKEESDESFEVETILSHKFIKRSKQLKFLIRWAGFDASHDQWLFEKNLNCPAILMDYKKRNHLV